jgi:hypothetical protein
MQKAGLFHPVIWCLFDDDDIMYMAFSEPRGRDLYKVGFCLKRFDISAPQIAHAGLYSADKLINRLCQGSTIGDPAYDTFGN